MTLACTKVTAYGIEPSEPLQKYWIQRMVLEYTGANTDATIDLGTYSGTFWTAVGSTAPGSVALTAIKNIQIAAKTPAVVSGLGIIGKAIISGTGGSVISYDSSASLGGAATEALTVTGLATTDTILAVTQVTKGANSTALNLWTDTGRTVNTLTVGWTANPGANAVVRVLVRKASAAVTPVSGQVQILPNATNTFIPDITFASGDAPTTGRLVLEWILKDQTGPIECYSAA